MPDSRHAQDGRARSPSSLSGSAAIEALVERTAPAILELLQDGTPRSRRAIVAALVDRHTKADVTRTLMRLAVTGRLEESGGKYRLAQDQG